MKPIRRVVSGHDERGRSVIAMDSEIGNLIGDDHEAAGALTLAELWSTAEMPIDNSGARDQARHAGCQARGALIRFVHCHRA